MSDTKPHSSASLALGVLVLVVVVSPWLFGATEPWAILSVTALGLVTAALVLGRGAFDAGVARPALPLWPLLGFVALGLAQLIPLPPAAHELLAPGSHAVWHPVTREAALLLGEGAHPISLDPDATLRSASLVAALGLLAVLAAPALARPGAAVAAVATVAAGGVALSAYAIFARTHFGTLLYGRIVVPTIAPFGPFVNKNHFAGYVGMAALLAGGLAVGLVNQARRRSRDWTTSPRAAVVVTAIVGTLAMTLAVLVSLSRGGALALVGGGASLLALLVLRRRTGRARLAPSLGLAVTLVLLLLILVPSTTHERLQTLGGASFRLDTWRDGLRMSLTSPLLGHGLGAFHDAYPRFKRGHGIIRVEHAENDYIETLGEGGVLGLSFCLAAALVLARASRRVLSGRPHVLQGIAIGAVAGLIGLGVHSAVDFDLRVPSNAALAALLAAIVAATSNGSSRRLPRGACALLAAVALGLLAAVCSLPDEPWLVAREETRLAALAGTAEARALRLDRAGTALVRVLRRRPAHAESWLMLAGARGAAGDRAAASALAVHAVSLDPERPELREAASRLTPGKLSVTHP